MRKATATYNAPDGDSKVVEMGGVMFKDGEPVELNTDDHGHMIGKLHGNPHFDIDVGEEEVKKNKGGRPSNADKAAEAAKEKAAQEEAERAKFEQSERERLAAAAKAN